MSINFTCVCGKEFTFSEKHAGLTGNCKDCGRPMTVPGADDEKKPEGALPSKVLETDTTVVEADHADSLCAFCQTPLEIGQKAFACPSCKVLYHPECWEDNGGCGIYGCEKAAEPEPRKELEIPTSFWGQEDKPCPSCGHTILAAAMRCRHCGALFKSARPEDSNEFRSRKQLERNFPKVRSGAIKLLIFCLVPFTAPIASIVGYFWYDNHQKELKDLPPIFMALTKLGLMAGIFQTFFMFIMAILFATFRAG